MPTLSINHFTGLWQGPIDNNASSVINAVADLENPSRWISIGDALFVKEPNPDELLPNVFYVNSALNSQKFIGIAVGGDAKGIYADAGDLVGKNSIDNVDTIATDTQLGVRVCTQGRCIARVVTNGIGDINIGDVLTPTGGPEGTLRLSTLSGDNLVARALQIALEGEPVGPDQYIAVDVQREGLLP